MSVFTQYCQGPITQAYGPVTGSKMSHPPFPVYTSTSEGSSCTCARSHNCQGHGPAQWGTATQTNSCFGVSCGCFDQAHQAPPGQGHSPQHGQGAVQWETSTQGNSCYNGCPGPGTITGNFQAQAMGHHAQQHVTTTCPTQGALTQCGGVYTCGHATACACPAQQAPPQAGFFPPSYRC